MVKLTRVINDFETLQDVLRFCRYRDDVVESTTQYADTHDNMKDIYDDLLNSVLHYIYQSVPSYFNPAYPYCINATVGPYGFSYMKDGMGLGIATKLNRKTGDATFTLTFYFNKDKHFLRHDETFNYCLENDFELIEIDNKKKKKK